SPRRSGPCFWRPATTGTILMKLGCIILVPILLSASSAVIAQKAPDTAPSRNELLYTNEPGPLLRADLRLERPLLQSGQPVWATFSLTNLSDKVISLQVPDAPAG